MLELINIKMILQQSWIGAEELIKLILFVLKILISLNLIKHIINLASEKNIVILIHRNLLINFSFKIIIKVNNVMIKNLFYFCNMSVNRKKNNNF